jgi:hypothetical protein
MSVVAAVAFAPRSADAQAAKILEQFSGTMTGVKPGTGETVTIDILRWSSDEDAQKLLAAYKDKSDKWADALQAQPLLGYVWTSSESLGYTIRYARRLDDAGGGERIILAVEHPLGSWERPAWKATVGSTDYPYSVIELRVSKLGLGVGKASLAGKVAVDDATHSVALENYASAPILLRGVKRGKTPAAASAATPAPAAKPAAPAPKPATPAAKPAAPAGSGKN